MRRKQQRKRGKDTPRSRQIKESIRNSSINLRKWNRKADDKEAAE